MTKCKCFAIGKQKIKGSVNQMSILKSIEDLFNYILPSMSNTKEMTHDTKVLTSSWEEKDKQQYTTQLTKP